MSKVAFLGAGNMAAAMVDGLVAKQVCSPTEIACYSASGKTAAALSQRAGIRQATSLSDLLANADVAIIAFKPQHLASADLTLAELTRGKLVISVLAGKRLSTLSRTFPHARALVRTMPNTPGQIGAGITGWCTSDPLDEGDRQLVSAVLEAMGATVEVEEKDMDALTAVSGSGPAYVFEFAAALRDAGIAAGLSRHVAEKLSVETLLGAARLLARKAIDPEVLRNQVTSPNGTTFAGLQRMAARDFRGTIQETVAAAKARSEELSRD